MITMYCVILFQTVTYWGPTGPDRVSVQIKDSRLEWALQATKELNYASPEYGHEVVSYGASMKCEEASATELLRRVGYTVNFDGDGGVCRETAS